MSLLERHLRMLQTAGVMGLVSALGFRHVLIEAEVDRLQWPPRPEIVINHKFEQGSVLTVHTVAQVLTRGGDVLLMDADVLHDERNMRALVAGYVSSGRDNSRMKKRLAIWFASAARRSRLATSRDRLGSRMILRLMWSAPLARWLRTATSYGNLTTNLSVPPSKTVCGRQERGVQLRH